MEDLFLLPFRERKRSRLEKISPGVPEVSKTKSRPTHARMAEWSVGLNVRGARRGQRWHLHRMIQSWLRSSGARERLSLKVESGPALALAQYALRTVRQITAVIARIFRSNNSDQFST